MKQSELERLLQRIQPHPAPKAEMEQYATPAPIAADILYRALGHGDIAGKRILDLGCGTGTLAIGAMLLGAREAVGVEIDDGALAVAREAAKDLGVEVDWHAGDVEACDCAADTAVMNPPFGSQRRHADRPFLEAALRNAPVVYSLHLAETLPFVREFVEELGANLDASWEYDLPIRWQFPWHEKRVERVRVVCVRCQRRD